MVNKSIRVGTFVSKTTQSAWIISLAALLIIKIFVKIVEAFYLDQQPAYLVSLCVFAFLFAVSTAGVLLKQKWGIGLSVAFAIFDIVVVSYVGGLWSLTSVIISVGILVACYFVNKYVFDK